MPRRNGLKWASLIRDRQREGEGGLLKEDYESLEQQFAQVYAA